MNYELRKKEGTSHAQSARLSRGFSLVELLVSIGIFVLITSVIVISQHNLGGTILITNLSYDVALSVRQAQVYGVSVSSVGQATPSFQKSYGIHFEQSGYYVLFAVDIGGDQRYDASVNNTSTGCMPSSKCISFFKIEQGNVISRFCADSYCAGAGTNNTISAMDIIFTRPNPEPTIYAYKNGALVSNTAGNATITVMSPQSLTKVVGVLSSGQIAVQ